MLPGTLTVLLLVQAAPATALPRAASPDDARRSVRAAHSAVAGDTVAPARARWEAALERNAADRGALLSLGTLARLTNDSAAASAWRTEPVWRPDGQRVAFRSKQNDPLGEIHVINADGTNEQRLTNNPTFDHDPGWSPNGARILFVSDRGGDDDIWIMNADGSGAATNLTSTPGIDELSPAMSPDGTKILYVVDAASAEIWIMNADGTGQTPLTGGAGDDEPAWSPDGTMIAFSRNSQIWTMNANGSNPRQWTSNNVDDEPAWSPDGTRIVFSRGQDGNRKLWGFRLSNGPGAEQLVSGSPGSSEHPSWRRP